MRHTNAAPSETINEARIIELSKALDFTSEAIASICEGHLTGARQPAFAAAVVLVGMLEKFKLGLPPDAASWATEKQSARLLKDVAVRTKALLGKAARATRGPNYATPIAALTSAVGLIAVAVRGAVNRDVKRVGQCVAWALEALAYAFAMLSEEPKRRSASAGPAMPQQQHSRTANEA